MPLPLAPHSNFSAVCLSALEPFLGPPTKAIDYDPSHSFPHEAWFLPDAYQGRNEYVRETIVQTVVNYNSFMTTEILPWRQQNNPNIAWDRVQFGASHAQCHFFLSFNTLCICRQDLDRHGARAGYPKIRDR